MFVSRNLVTVYLALCCGVEKCAKMKSKRERSKWRAAVRCSCVTFLTELF